MQSIIQDKQQDEMDQERPVISETAELPFLILEENDEPANDNIPALEGLNGCVWRDTVTLQQRAGAEEEVEVQGAHRSDEISELDFSNERSRRRGFLDDRHWRPC